MTDGVLVTGASLATASPDEDKTKCYDSAVELSGRFETSFVATSCEAPNESDFTSAHHRVQCRWFLEEATQSALEVLRMP